MFSYTWDKYMQYILILENLVDYIKLFCALDEFIAETNSIYEK